MKPLTILRHKKSISLQNLLPKTGSGAKTWLTGRSLAIIIAAVLLVGCGPAAGPGPDAAQNGATMVLPTGKPTPAPSPSSTRVMPLETVPPTPRLLVTPSPTSLPDEVRGLVADVISGDTISVVLEGDPPNRTYPVRYIGIEAPANEPGEPWGVAAYELNRKMTNMKVIRLVADENKTDDEGNLLRYVYAGDELMSIIMVEQGLARADINPPNTRFEEETLEAESRARAGNLGLWGQSPTASPVSAEETTVTPEPTATETDTATSEGTPAASPEATGTEEATAEATP